MGSEVTCSFRGDASANDILESALGNEQAVVAIKQKLADDAELRGKVQEIFDDLEFADVFDVQDPLASLRESLDTDKQAQLGEMLRPYAKAK